VAVRLCLASLVTASLAIGREPRWTHHISTRPIVSASAHDAESDTMIDESRPPAAQPQRGRRR
jgi:hypothetical protein